MSRKSKAVIISIEEGIKNHLLLELVKHGSDDLEDAVRKNEAAILEDIQKIREEAGDDDPVKFKASLSVTLDLNKSAVDTAFSWSVKKTVKNSHAISKPDEPEFEFSPEDN